MSLRQIFCNHNFKTILKVPFEKRITYEYPKESLSRKGIIIVQECQLCGLIKKTQIRA